MPASYGLHIRRQAGNDAHLPSPAAALAPRRVSFSGRRWLRERGQREYAQMRKDDVGFCQIGKEAICFAARFNGAMRRQSDLVD